jgi:hypothetical protein
MDEYCSFRKCGCPIPPKSLFTCFKGDEKWCAIAVTIRKKQKEENQEDKVILLGR